MADPTGVIHDLGYQPYQGPRRARARRFLVISRNLVSVAWRSRAVRWSFIVAGIVTIVAAVVMYFMRHELAQQLRTRGAPLPRPDAVIFHANNFFSFIGFILAAVVGCGAVADDLQLGAFQFYFARPIRPRDYVAGKLLGLFVVVGLPLVGGPFLLSVFRVLIAADAADAVRALPTVPRALALGVVGAAVIGLPAVGLGAWLRRRRLTQAVFAIYYVVAAPMAVGLAEGLRVRWLKLLSASADLERVGRALFGIDPAPNDPPAWAALLAAAALVAVAYLVVHRRVSRAETAGLGGG